jgi:FMN reductase
MAHILTISGSPSATSKTTRVLVQVEDRLAAQGHAVQRLAVRDLPPAALLAADTGDPAIRSALDLVAAADGVIIATPIYKASYTGLLKALLDLFPQFALAGKAVLPLATGGTLAHVLAIDYALRPVLTSMGARHIVQGYFLLDTLIASGPEGDVTLDPDAAVALGAIVDGFAGALDRPAALVRTA